MEVKASQGTVSHGRCKHLLQSRSSKLSVTSTTCARKEIATASKVRKIFLSMVARPLSYAVLFCACCGST
eukprot:3978886-Amphidinium_carterae.2